MQILEEDIGLINYIEQPDGVFNGLDQVSIQKEDKKIRGNLLKVETKEYKIKKG